MTRAEIDTLWQQAMAQAIKDGEMFTRYHFAALVEDRAAAAEREACIKTVEGLVHGNVKTCAAAIRARGDA